MTANPEQIARRMEDLQREWDEGAPGADKCPFDYGHVYRDPWLMGYAAHQAEIADALARRYLQE